MARLSCIMGSSMDVVYICKPGDNEELRYSIRSVVKNLPHDKIWVVGGKPNWYIGNHIPVSQNRSKYVNAKNNLRAICNSPEISESFILMNDDFYIINKIDTLPNTHGGFLLDKIRNYKINNGLDPNISVYGRMLIKTESLIYRKIKNKVINYELHVPMIMEKKKLSKIMLLDGLWRSVYGNFYNVGGIEMDDVKVYGLNSKQKSYDITNLRYDYLSSSDDSFKRIKELILDNRFRSKSVYEI